MKTRTASSFLTENLINELLDYNPLTGVFIDKKRNRVAGCVHKHNGYIYITINKVQYLAHRLAWYMTYGEFPKAGIDHKNRDKTDNRISNLRDVSQAENMKNKSMYKTNKTGVTGVRRNDNGKYLVTIGSFYIGTFETMIEASRARELAEIKYGYHKLPV